jgi:hypothetical protein
MSSAGDALRPLLGALGKPAIVVARVDLSTSTHLCFPALQKLFLGRFLSLDGIEADVFYKAAVPQE